MIDITKTRHSKVAEKKEAPTSEKIAKIPFYCIDSAEVEFIREKIKANKEYLSKCSNLAAYKKVEKDTLFLENNILPVLLAKTNLFYNESTKLFIQSLDKAVQAECHSMLMYLPINPNYTDRPKAGVANCIEKINKTPDTVQLRADFYLYNNDGNAAPFEYIDLCI